MLDQTPARPAIGEPPPQGGSQPGLASRRSSDPADPTNSLGKPAGMLSDTGDERRLPVLRPVASTPVLRRHRPPALPIGILLYLVSVAVIATATVGVFFGIGFFLLVQPTEAMIPDAGARDRGSANEPLLYSLVPSFLSGSSPADGRTASVPIEPEIPHSAAIAALPIAPPPQPSATDQSPPLKADAAPPSGVGEAAGSESREAPPAASPPAAPAVVPAPRLSAAAATPAPSGPGTTATDVAELLARGDAFLLIGDLTSARLFYERAADAGDRQAAMRMGATFDPAFLGRAGLRGARGDPAKANSWYSHALDLGAPGTDRQAKSLGTK
jgi:hypothetical protein